MSWRNAEKIEFPEGKRNNSGVQQAGETHTVNKINYICDFSRGGLNTRLYTLVSKPCSEATSIVYFIYCVPSLAVWQRQNSGNSCLWLEISSCVWREFGTFARGCLKNYSYKLYAPNLQKAFFKYSPGDCNFIIVLHPCEVPGNWIIEDSRLIS